jgi:hypothetical protein
VPRPDLIRPCPALPGLRHYKRSWLRYDVLAGVTVAAYLIPQVMAYAEVTGLPAVVGLWAIVGPLLVYAVLGSSGQLSVGPESTTALMTAAAVGSIAAGDPDRYAALAAALCFVVGGLCIPGWIGRLGFLADLLSKPVLVESSTPNGTPKATWPIWPQTPTPAFKTSSVRGGFQRDPEAASGRIAGYLWRLVGRNPSRLADLTS